MMEGKAPPPGVLKAELAKVSDRYIPAEDLIQQLRHAGSVWFRNSDLLLLEELIRRFKILLVNQKETT